MANRVTISGPAKDDLDAIWDFLAKEASPEIADFVIARLFEAGLRSIHLCILRRTSAGSRGG